MNFSKFMLQTTGYEDFFLFQGGPGLDGGKPSNFIFLF